MAEENGTAPGVEGGEAENATPAADETDALRVEVADLKDRLTRSFAEMENLRTTATSW